MHIQISPCKIIIILLTISHMKFQLVETLTKGYIHQSLKNNI